MAAPELIDPVNASLLATSFGQSVSMAAQGMTFVMERQRLKAMEQDEKIGTREAQAMQEVRQSAQAREILQARAAVDQPGKAGA